MANPAVMGPTPDPARNAAILPMPAPVVSRDSGGADTAGAVAAVPGAVQPAAPNPMESPLPTTRTAPAAVTGAPPAPDRERALGKAVKFLLGSTTQYSVDPQTGKTVATDVPNKPGDLFRHILAGAILGGAAGAKAKDFTQGLGEGAGAEQEQLRNNDQINFARAQEQFKNQQEAQRTQREGKVLEREDKQLEFERTKFNAQVQQWNKEELLHEADANFKDQEMLFHENEQSQNLEKWAVESGGILTPNVPGNGRAGNGKDLMNLFTKDPNRFTPPPGMSSFIVKTYDTGDLKYDFKTNGWQDKDGKAVNLEDRTTWNVYAVPMNTAKTPIKIDGKTLMKNFKSVVGDSLQGDKQYSLTLSEVLALSAQERMANRLQFDEAFKTNHQAVAAKLSEYTKGIADLTREATNARSNGQDEEAAQFDKQIADMQQELDDYLLENANPAMRGTYRDGVNKATGNASKKKAAAGPDVTALQQQVAQMPGGWGSVKDNETVIADSKGNLSAIPKSKLDQAKTKGYVEVPRPAISTPQAAAATPVAQAAPAAEPTTRTTGKYEEPATD
ncbi:MAG: hypothetical protein JWQ87_2021 [Candidatus Sulfotelmatobacter sp.]|nr:hypothetical protein [Candidatus Sulfotelmatobacter sp.]